MTTTNDKVNAMTIHETIPTRMQNYRLHLRTITNGLIEMAKAAGRNKFSYNQLLRECYNLMDSELMTYDQWKEQGAYVRRGEHAYLFWGNPITTEAGYRFYPIQFLFSREQVRFRTTD